MLKSLFTRGISLSKKNYNNNTNIPAIQEELSTDLVLGDHHLKFTKNGQWILDGLEQVKQKHHEAEHSVIKHQNELEAQKLSYNELEDKYRKTLQELYEVQCINDELAFQNKMLVAMCAVSEGDYTALAEECGYEKRDQTLHH